MTGEAALPLATGRMESAPDQLAVLFDCHHARLYRLARRLSRDADDARDLVQETFLRAAGARRLPDTAQEQEAWLVRVLVNLCRDRWRQIEVRRRLTPTFEASSPAAAANQEAALLARSVVWHALETLPPRRRAVIVMHELEELSIAEIARLLGVASVTVRWHLSIGRRELARLIRSNR